MATAWEDLLEALTILSQRPGNLISPFYCSHDTLTVTCDPADFTTTEIARLDDLGFFADDECFQSYRFGSA